MAVDASQTALLSTIVANRNGMDRDVLSIQHDPIGTHRGCWSTRLWTRNAFRASNKSRHGRKEKEIQENTTVKPQLSRRSNYEAALNAANKAVKEAV